MGMSVGTTMPIIAPETSVPTRMELVHQWLILLLSVITDMAFYSPSSGDDLGNKQLHIVVVSHALVWSWMMWLIMTTQAATAPYIAWRTWLLAVPAPNYLYLHEMETSPINYINYWKYFKFGHFIRTPPGKWNIKYRCFAPSTDCTNFGSDECYARVSCCYICNPTPAAMTTPEAMYKTVSREILPRHDTTTSAVLWLGHYICKMKAN